MQFLTKVCWLAMTLCLGSVWSTRWRNPQLNKPRRR